MPPRRRTGFALPRKSKQKSGTRQASGRKTNAVGQLHDLAIQINRLIDQLSTDE
jgi:hypothetical protein